MHLFANYSIRSFYSLSITNYARPFLIFFLIFPTVGFLAFSGGIEMEHWPKFNRKSFEKHTVATKKIIKIDAIKLRLNTLSFYKVLGTIFYISILRITS